MKRPMKTALVAGFATALISASAAAQPYCDALLNADSLAKKYQRLAPIHSSQDTGWIFTSDHLNDAYAMKSSAQALFKQIVAEFEASGVHLAVLVAPPRPVIAGQSVVDATLGANASFDVATAAASFQQMIQQINAAGAIAPDLLRTASTQGDYYFMRDTHWTNTGAAHSIDALARMLVTDPVALDPATLPIADTFAEPGSLSKIVDATCGRRGANEPTPVFDYASLRPAQDLLADTSSAPSIALLGTSFSNRYKRDQYQVADALATATGTNVENFSVSGGGAIGPIESYILSGALAAKAHDTVVWEFPYTQSMNSTSGLRQLLGALRVANATEGGANVLTLDAKGQTEIAVRADTQPNLVVINDLPTKTSKISVDVILANGSKKTIKLRRKSAFVDNPDLGSWAADLSGLSKHPIASIRLRFDRKAAGQQVSLRFGA